ncbi:MAG: FAD-dependent oxidoreductase [Candidatus Kapaibacterium sp.]
MKKVVIIGGMAAGCKAAARLRRLEAETEITIIEQRSFLSYGSCGMPFYASGEVQSFDELMKTPYGLVRDEKFFEKIKGIKALTNTKALEINRDINSVKCLDINTGKEFVLKYDKLLIATGASTMPVPFPCAESDKIFTFHNPLDARQFREKAQTGQIGKAIIIGGGYIGCELAEATTAMWGIETILIEKEDRLLPKTLDEEISTILRKRLEENDISIKTACTVKEIFINDSGNPVVKTDLGEFDADMVFLCLGVKPESAIAEKAGITTENGLIRVDEYMRSSDPDIYAAGDCVSVRNLITGSMCFLPLGSIANRQGRVAADNIAGTINSFAGAAGAVSIKVFDLITASCGLNTSSAENCGYDTDSVFISMKDRPEYHPDAQEIYGKMIYEKRTGKLLGLQLAGEGEVTRYLDTFCAFASRGETYSSLMESEHAYTPPHSGPVSILNFLGYMAEDKVRGAKSLSRLPDDEISQVIDVREKDEIGDGALPEGTLNIPLSELRDKIPLHLKHNPVITVCERGLRSYEALIILKTSGFENVRYLSGGASFIKIMK